MRGGAALCGPPPREIDPRCFMAHFGGPFIVVAKQNMPTHDSEGSGYGLLSLFLGNAYRRRRMDRIEEDIASLTELLSDGLSTAGSTTR